jgi:hypothetical protein
MKKVNTIYWIFTILLILLMAFSAVGTIFMKNAQSEAMLKQMQYPYYLMEILSAAKILGIIALLVPGFRRLKEWAYAGFTFDLLGATISFIATGFSFANWVAPLVCLVLVAVSYIYWHKKLKLQGQDF